MRDGLIKIRGARQNNLVGIDVDIPRNRLVAITGVSGSGKSSLAFDTLFREGQRRFLETLSAYARQFLGRMEKPDIDSIEGLSPAIAVDQQAMSRGARSTVGTLTEIVDHMRVLYARAGRAHCPQCKLPVHSQTPEEIAQQIQREFGGEQVLLMAPVVRDRKGSHRALLDDLRKKGFVRARVDGEVKRLEDVGELERYVRHSIDVVVDRLKPEPEKPSRLREALEQALELGGGEVRIAASSTERAYSTSRTCPGCGAETPPLEPRLFSFNSPHGACPECNGLGTLRRASAASVVRDASLTIREGALAVTRASGGALLLPHVAFQFLEQIAQAHGFDLDTPWRELTPAARDIVLNGAGEERFEDRAQWQGKKFQGSVRWQRRYHGVLPSIQRALREGRHKKQVERFLSVQPCLACDGSRLKPAANAVLLGGVPFAELTRTPVARLKPRFDALELTPREARIAVDLLAEIRRRIDFLLEVGLSYLTLDRSADSLSSGEAQRIRLAAQLGAGLRGVLYVLDEPSIGLHARDHGRLLSALKRLRDVGNTVVVVEHDEATLRAADWLIDVGPGAGRHGGRIIAQGAPATVAVSDTPTGRLLRGELELVAPRERRRGNGKAITVAGARGFNLKGIDVRFPLGTLTAVSGVSGSGKSTLVHRILERALLRKLGREAPEPEAHKQITGLDQVDELVAIDSTPIGRTPRSNPATYTGVLDPIRDLFASLPEAKLRGYSKSRFSFNVPGGRCEACGGAGARYVELQFLAPVTVPCEECGGHRFQAETLDVLYREKSIADVLALTAEDALAIFKDHPKIARQLATMVEIGLGYLTLGQPSTTLSGGEAQRIKLVTELSKRPKGHTLYVLDEPTTGLHMQDVARLVAALQSLVDLGHTVIVVEHNLDLVRAADHVIDLGPEGGDEGGELIAFGTPEEIQREKRSHTGAALKALARSRASGELVAETPDIPAPTLSARLEVRGARTHNLKNIDVSLPRDAMTVITGPSGSGKSSLALDTIHTEGRRRFVESLSTYARQFLGTKDRPPVDHIEGLGPSVAVEARTVSAQPRSTVSTTTEIHDHLRVLWARAGTRRCPTHGHKLERVDPGRIAKRAIAELDGRTGWVLAPIFGPSVVEPADLSAAFKERSTGWRAAGFARVLLDQVEARLDGELSALRQASRVDLVIDRTTFETASRARIADAAEQASQAGAGRVSVLVREKSGGAGTRLEFSTHGACPECGFQTDGELEPRHFSFNTHVGACAECDGLGEKVQCEAELLVAHPEASLLEGALVSKLGRYLTKGKGYYENLLHSVAKAHKVDLARPWRDLSPADQRLLAYGEGAKPSYRVHLERSTENAEIEENFVATWPGLCGHVDAWHQKTEDAEWAAILETVMSHRTCGACRGERLRPAMRAVTIEKLRLPDLLRFSVGEALRWIEKIGKRGSLADSVGAVIAEIASRLSLLERVGLDYLTLDRPTSTLSGGESRRVRLSASLGSELVGVCYVLDEPTVGLHPADVDKLTDTLLELCDRGNTVIVVEHDQAVMARADWIVDMGPGAGRDGGSVVVSGTPAEVARHPESQTGKALRGEIRFERTARESTRSGELVRLVGASTHNLKSVDFEFRFGEITGVCGPSGSGKSTLILDTLVPAMSGARPEGRWKRLIAPPGGGVRAVVVDASPIGRTPASIPATYSGVMDPIRELYARTPDAKVKGFDAGRFSFNSPKGRCVACEGRGATKVEMQFLADLWLTCEECDGKRYAPEILEVRHRGRDIAAALELTVDEALEFFEHQPKIASVLESLRDVGLGYMTLGQSSTTLSGGEAQRVKLAAELYRADLGPKSVVILDEPSTGLSNADVAKLVAVFDRLAERENALVVIEHHTGILLACDRLVELGPAGGERGGSIVATGTPVELARNPKSLTGPWLDTSRVRAISAKPRGKEPRRRTREAIT